jgi:hypothetical protein
VQLKNLAALIGSKTGTCRDGLPHPGNITHRRCSEEPFILAGKVRGIVIPDARAGARRIKVFAEQVERLNNLTPATGERHDEANMASIGR